jgi:poly-gamma-glutamate capsule biosynthesis protein CapA/YwtB (metallophosphatase superfamily)
MSAARLLLALAVAAAVLAGCADTDQRATSRPVTPRPSVARPPATAPQPLAVVGHATRPQLDLTQSQARRVLSGRATRWQGRRVLTRLRPDAAIAAVERDPSVLAVVPLAAVGPTVAAARVGGVDPVRDHADARTLVVAGDVMLTRGVRDPAAALAPMTPLLRRADLTVGNLESTLSTRGAATQGGDSFGGSPALLGPLGRAGFDALSLANNHAGDFGDRALLDTVARLAASPVVPFGAGADARAAARPATLERGGVRFGLVGFNAIGETRRAAPGTPGALSVRMPPRTGPLVRSDLDRVLSVVRRTARQADVVVVLPHWGTQYTHAPEPIQRQVGRALVGAGADLVVGGHPHWVQGVDAVRGVPVLHSLGNFVFDMDFMEQTMEGVVLEATFWGERLKAIRLLPYRMDPGTFAPRRVRGAVAARILADVWSTSTGPYAAR